MPLPSLNILVWHVDVVEFATHQRVHIIDRLLAVNVRDNVLIRDILLAALLLIVGVLRRGRSSTALIDALDVELE